VCAVVCVYLCVCVCGGGVPQALCTVLCYLALQLSATMPRWQVVARAASALACAAAAGYGGET
jgi:hypothetical protein